MAIRSVNSSHPEDSRFSSSATGNSRVCTRRFAFIRAVGRGAKRQMFSWSGWHRVELLWGERANALPFLPLVSRFQWFQLTSSLPSWQQRAPCLTALPLFAAFITPGLYSWRETLSNARVSCCTRLFASNYVTWNQNRWIMSIDKLWFLKDILRNRNRRIFTFRRTGRSFIENWWYSTINTILCTIIIVAII